MERDERANQGQRDRVAREIRLFEARFARVPVEPVEEIVQEVTVSKKK